MRLLLAIVVILLGPLVSASAAPPKVDSFFPAGGQRGQTISVTATGDFSTWPVSVWADQPGITATAEKDKGKFSVVIAADTAPGVVWLRAYNEEGAAALKPFVVGTLPEVEEVEPNDTPAKPQPVAEKIVINGRLANSGDVDGFAVALKQGQTLAASLQANEVLGSPMDGVLQICELVERRGKPEAFVVAQNHDAIGLDPQLAFTAPRDGNYLVRSFAYPAVADANINFSANANYIYRLTLTTGGFADHALPLAIRRGQPAEVKLFGWNLPPGGSPLTVQSPGDPLVSRTAAFQTDVAGAIPVAIVDHASVVEQPGQALELPIVVSGQLSQEKEADSFTFSGKKGVKLQLTCESRSLGYPLRAMLQIKDEAGKTLAAAEPKEPNRETELAFTPPADARYVVSLSDEHGRGGMRFVYRLTLEEVRPDFGLSVAADSFVLAADKPLEIPVTLAVREGLAEAIEIKAMDLPASVTCEPVKSAAPPKMGEMVKLVLKAAPEAVAVSGPIRIVGTAGTLTRAVTLPPSQSTAIWLTVKK
jgi:hypothetical protein